MLGQEKDTLDHFRDEVTKAPYKMEFYKTIYSEKSQAMPAIWDNGNTV
jgi:hypothetical protein